MKIILINELYQMGGAEMQTLREIALLRQNGHEVYHISCDKSLPEGWDKSDENHYNIVPEDKSKMNWHVKRIKRFFSSKKFEITISSLIEKIDPDVIHINNMTYNPITVYKALRKWPTVQTIRDFGVVCPNELCVTKDYQTCCGYLHKHCVHICAVNKPFRKKIYFAMDKLYLKWVNFYRCKGIDKFICPSEYLSNTCVDNCIPAHVLNNSFDFSKIHGFKKNVFFERKVYLVYGLVAKHKGILQIIDAFKKFSKDKDVELQIIGKIESGFEEQINCAINKHEKIHYLGQMTYSDIISHLSVVYAVVVPSLWLENYPNTALEGLATKCLVLGSNRGGIPELICNDKFTFDILDQSDIIEKLEYSYKLQVEDYRRIIDSNFNRVITNNSLDTYYERIINVFQELVNRS